MYKEHAISGESSWQQMMELELRKEVIEGWLSCSDVPSQLVEVLKEMLAATERELQEVRSQGFDKTSSSPLGEAE
jgi:hypothetical protein